MDGDLVYDPVMRKPKGTAPRTQVLPVVETRTRGTDGCVQSRPIATIRELVAAKLVGQNVETTPWTGAAIQDVDAPVDERQTRVIVLDPLRTNAMKP